MQLQRKTSLEKLDTLYHLSNEQEMKTLIRLCTGCNRLICAFDVRKGIKQVFLWPGSIYLSLLPGVGKRGICSPPPPPRHCRTMNDWLWGRGVMGICSPFTSTPPNPYIFVWVWWLKGQAGYPGFCMASTCTYQTSQNYLCSLEITCIRRKVLFVCFGVLLPSQHYLGYF